MGRWSITDPIKTAVELVRVKSISGEEKEIAYLIRDLLLEVGVDKAYIDGFGNVIGEVKNGSSHNLVFEGHMDHVPEGDIEQWSYPPYEGLIVDDKLFGRGSVDMKGAIAAMIGSVELLGEGDLPNTYYVFVPFEEISEGTLFKLAIEETLRINPSLVVLGEATKLNIYRGHRGRSVWKITLHGRSSHASMPEQGVNPIIGAAKILDELEKKILSSHPVLGSSSWAPTIIECSPKSTPMIPDKCVLYIDYRLVIGESRYTIRSFMEEAARDIMEKGGITGYSIDVNRGEARMWTGRNIFYEDFYNSWLYEDYVLLGKIRTIVKRHVKEADIGVWRFSTDGVYSAGEAGYPTIGIGPGDENLAHKPNEYVPVSHIVKVRDIYADLANNFRNIIQ